MCLLHGENLPLFQSTTAVAIYGPEAAKLDEAYAYLYQALASPGKITARPLDKTHLDAIEQILDRWPSSSRFPSKLGHFLGRRRATQQPDPFLPQLSI